MPNAESVRSTAPLIDEVLGLVQRLVSALDAREHETEIHSLRVAEYALRLAEEIDLPPAQRSDLKFGALLHDIGKIAISDAVLLKPGPLTDEEWEQVRRHPMIGFQILRDFTFLESAARIVLYHQERFDGSGYPFGLAGDAIPIGARLFAIVDTFDAMTTDRPYRAAGGYDDVVREMSDQRGAQFDPDLVDAFLRISAEEWARVRDMDKVSPLTWPATAPGDAAEAQR